MPPGAPIISAVPDIEAGPDVPSSGYAAPEAPVVLPPVEVAGVAARPLPSVPRIRGVGWAPDAELEQLRGWVATAENEPARGPELAAALLEAASRRLAAHGVTTRPVQTAEGHPGLRIEPDPDVPLGALADFLQREVDGFSLIYAPAKLFSDRTRGAVWGYQREVLAAHDLVFEGVPDPITLHEVEHAVLNLGEEQGLASPWLGYLQSIDGAPLSGVDAEQGGYITYCSLQELPAYAAQLRALARRLDAAPAAGRDLDELEAMARWGRALSGRAADVVARAAEQLEAHPDNAVFEARRLTPAGRDPAGTPEQLWVSVERPEARVSIPLFEPGLLEQHRRMLGAEDPAGWSAARAPLLSTTRRRLEVARGGAVTARAAFTEIEARAAALRAVPEASSADVRALARFALKTAWV